MKNLLAALSTILILSCGTNPEKESGINSVSLRIAFSGLKTKIDSCYATIKGNDIELIGKTLTITDSLIEGTFAKIPTGKKRIVEIMAYDSAKVLVYYGVDTIDVIAGRESIVEIVLNRVASSISIKGSIHDSLVSFQKAFAYYPLDGNAKDVVGGHDGTIFGTLTPVSDRNGIPNSAFYFGQNNYITIPKLNLTGDVTFFGWFRAKASSAPYHVSLIGQGTSYSERWCLTGSKSELVFYDRRPSDNAPYLYSKALNQNQWYSLAAVSSDSFSANKKVKLFLNGVFEGEVSTRAFSEINSVYNIGKYYSEGGWDFSNGDIDDLIIFNRQLSNGEIKNIHENGFKY